MDWSSHYPAFVDERGTSDNTIGVKRLIKDVEIADIGCGFGGLLVALSPLFPEVLMLGLELRLQVTDYVNSRILALRSQSQSSILTATSTYGPYQNISVLRANTMKFLPNYFKRSQLSRIFLCFPDPHFKARKHKARIVSTSLNAEYAYALKPGGLIYTITDVEELHQWIVRHFSVQEGGSGELFERVGEDELQKDACVRIMQEETEEGKKVTRNGGQKFVAVWRRKEDPPWP